MRVVLRSIQVVSRDIWVYVVTELSLYVAPSAGTGWEDAFAQAGAFVAQLTLEEKAGLVTGTAQGPCIGEIDMSGYHTMQQTHHAYR